MGKYMRKCRGIGELSVMEVSQVVGVRTRARTLALATAAAAAAAAGRSVGDGEFQISYLQLRSRRLVMSPEKKRRATQTPPISVTNSSEKGRLSRCSSNASSELVEKASSRSGHPEGEGFETEANYSDCDYESLRGEKTPSSELGGHETGDLESTAKPAESNARRRPTPGRDASRMPSQTEIEEFFSTAELTEAKRFSDKYNYDVVKDSPLEGRYEWVRLKP